MENSIRDPEEQRRRRNYPLMITFNPPPPFFKHISGSAHSLKCTSKVLEENYFLWAWKKKNLM